MRRLIILASLLLANAWASRVLAAGRSNKPIEVPSLQSLREQPKGGISESSQNVYAARKKKQKNRRKRPQCNDRKDNDRDGLIDYPVDPGCHSKKDKREKNAPTSGGGGTGINLDGRRPFPDDNPWNLDISQSPIDPNSEALISSIGNETGLHPDFGTVWEGAPIGIPFVVVSGTQPNVQIGPIEYEDESDPDPYPIPDDAPIEGGAQSDGDRHVIVIDRDNWMLYELFYAFKTSSGWRAAGAAKFNLNSNDLRPAGWTSADAAGLPIFPGLVRYEEAVERGLINHALRFTVSRSRRAYVSPARHFASSNTSASLPPMGMRVRLKSSVDISSYPSPVRVVLTALKTYGMFVADNGSNWYISGAPDSRWNDEELSTIRSIRGHDFEVIQMGEIVTD